MMNELLQSYLDTHRSKRFCWREWNCVYFIAGWVAAVEGLDILGVYNKQTHTAMAAARLARDLGGLRAAMSQALGRDTVPPLQACVGDVMYCGTNSAAGTLAICNGATAIGLSMDTGFAPVSMYSFTHAWKLHREV